MDTLLGRERILSFVGEIHSHRFHTAIPMKVRNIGCDMFLKLTRRVYVRDWKTRSRLSSFDEGTIVMPLGPVLVLHGLSQRAILVDGSIFLAHPIALQGHDRLGS
jgi:hypothetical protein